MTGPGRWWWDREMTGDEAAAGWFGDSRIGW